MGQLEWVCPPFFFQNFQAPPLPIWTLKWPISWHKNGHIDPYWTFEVASKGHFENSRGNTVPPIPLPPPPQICLKVLCGIGSNRDRYGIRFTGTKYRGIGRLFGILKKIQNKFYNWDLGLTFPFQIYSLKHISWDFLLIWINNLPSGWYLIFLSSYFP